MTKFNDFTKEFEKFQEGKDYKLSNEKGKTYTIHSEELKKNLREMLSKWEGALEAKNSGKGFTDHKLAQDGKLGLYRESSSSLDEFILISDEGKNVANRPKSSTFPQLPQAPQAPQKPQVPTPIGKKPGGDYNSFTFRKDEKTGERSWEGKTKRGSEERTLIVQEAENKLITLKSLPDDVKVSFSQEISDLEWQIRELKQQVKGQTNDAQRQVSDQQANEQADQARSQVEAFKNSPFWKSWMSGK